MCKIVSFCMRANNDKCDYLHSLWLSVTYENGEQYAAIIHTYQLG